MVGFAEVRAGAALAKTKTRPTCPKNIPSSNDQARSWVDSEAPGLAFRSAYDLDAPRCLRA